MRELLHYNPRMIRTSAKSAAARWWQLTPKRLLAALLPLALLALAAQPNTDPDLWWHLRTGQWILENRAVPHADPFSSTHDGTPWVAHEWLADIGLYRLYQAGGFGALSLVTAIVITAAFSLVYLASDLRPHLAIFTTLLAALASAVTWGPRPQMLTLLFSALTLLLLHQGRTRRRRLWLLPILMLVWANVHSGFFLGLVMIASVLAGACIEWLIGRRRSVPGAQIGTADGTGAAQVIRTLAAALIASIVAACINPNGFVLLVYPYFTLTSKAMQTYIVEWHSPDFHDPRFLPFAALLLILIFVLALSPKSPAAGDLILLSGLGYESLVSNRNIPLFALVVAPVLTRQVRAILDTRPKADATSSTARPPDAISRRVLILNWTLAALMVIFVFARVASVLTTEVPLARAFPIGAANYLAEKQPAGPLLNSYNFGGYLIWRLFPAYRVFIDGRADVYGDSFMDEYYARIWQGKGDWQAYLDRFGIRLIVMEKDGVLSALLRTQPQWKLVYEDDLSSIFVRAD
jgi:hypothetical protein